MEPSQPTSVAPLQTRSLQRDVQGVMLDYTYQHLGVAAGGSAAASAIFASVLLQGPAHFGTLVWLTVQLLISAFGFWLWRGYTAGWWPRQDPRRAWQAHGGFMLSLGLAWGSAGYVWSDLSTEVGLACLLGTAGLSSVASLASASDPVGVWLFNGPVLAPWAVLHASQRPWFAVLVLVHLVVTMVVCYRVRRFVERSTILRFDNAELLALALEHRKTTEHALERAVQAVETRNRFLASVAHELRQPLQALVLFADVLHEPLDEVRRRDVVAAVTRTTQGLNETVEGLLALSRKDS